MAVTLRRIADVSATLQQEERKADWCNTPRGVLARLSWEFQQDARLLTVMGHKNY
jgi:hypothetical protein